MRLVIINTMIVTIVMILANLFSNDEIKIKQMYK